MVSFFSMFSPNEITSFLFGCMLVDAQLEEKQMTDKSRLLAQVAAIANGEAESAGTGRGDFTNRSHTTKKSERSQFDLPRLPEIYGLK